MKRKRSKAIFKPNTQNQLMLPTNLNELIPEKHLVREINKVIDEMDLEPLLKQYIRRGYEQLPSEDDAESNGVCVHL